VEPETPATRRPELTARNSTQRTALAGALLEATAIPARKGVRAAMGAGTAPEAGEAEVVTVARVVALVIARHQLTAIRAERPERPFKD